MDSTSFTADPVRFARTEGEPRMLIENSRGSWLASTYVTAFKPPMVAGFPELRIQTDVCAAQVLALLLKQNGPQVFDFAQGYSAGHYLESASHPCPSPGVDAAAEPSNGGGVPRETAAPALIVRDTAGFGERLAMGTRVLQFDRWTSIEDLRVGDRVMGADGAAHNVTATCRHEDRPLYRIRFNDRTWVDADNEHLWAVERVRCVTHKRHILTTEQILERGVADDWGNSTWRIPLVQPVQHATAQLDSDPYVVGVALGDGWHRRSSADQWMVTTNDEILDRIKAVWRSKHASAGIGVGMVRVQGLVGALANAKAVPEAYMFGDIGQRRAVLAGLLDTDGGVNPCGTVQFSSASNQLAGQVVALVQSLGGTATRRIKMFPRYTYKGECRTGQPSHVVTVRLRFNPFQFSSKAAKWTPFSKYEPTRIIRSIERISNGPGVCISVDSPDSLYVVKDHVVTHNAD